MTNRDSILIVLFVDRSLRFRYYQRNLLGTQLAQIDNHPRCQTAAALVTNQPLTMGSDFDRFPTASPQAASYLRHQRWPRFVTM